MLRDLPNIDPAAFQPADSSLLQQAPVVGHRPRILLLYGSLRARSFSRFAVEETARLLQAFGAETRIFDPSVCLLPTTRRRRIRKWSNCVSCRRGRRGTSGAAPNATAP